MQNEMADNPAKQTIPELSKKNRNFLKKAFRIFLFGLTFLFLLIIISLLLLQTSFVKNKILDFALDKINDNLKDKESVLYAESIEGNFFSGVKLNNIYLITRNDTLIKLNSIEIHYNLFPLLDNKIISTDLIIDKPQFNFTKIKDKNDSLIWNYEYLLKSEAPEDTAKKEFDWDIQLKNLKITGCDIRFLAIKDSDLPVRMLKIKNQEFLDIKNLDISNLNLELDARYSKNNKKLELRDLSFNTNSSFNLDTLSFAVNMNDDGIFSLNKLIFKTDKSNLGIKYLNINNFRPFENFNYENLGECKLQTEILIDRVDASDFNYFFPDLKLFNGRFYLDLKANGEYKNLYIERLVTKSRNSEINAAGNIKNLQIPENITLDVKTKRCSIDPDDIKFNLPGIDIPDYSHIGNFNFNCLYRGDFKKFYSEYDVNSSVGNISGDAYIDISKDILQYKTNNTFSSVNVGKIIKNNELESYLNGNLKISGSGTNYKTLTANIDYELNNSKIYKQNILNSAGSIKAINSSFDVRILYNSSNVASQISGNININDTKNIKYDLNGYAKNLDIAGFTNSPSNKSNLNFAFNLKGQGTDLQNLNGNFQFNVLNSQYQNYLIPETPLTISLNNSGSGKEVNINSNFLDFKATGIFSLNSLPKVIMANTESIAQSFEKQFVIDTSFTISNSTNISRYFDVVNMQYTMRIKNFMPFNLFLNNDNIKLRADIAGNIKNNQDAFTFTAQGNLYDFKLNDSLTNIENTLFSFDINSPHSGFTPGNITTNASIKSEKIIINGYKIDTLDAVININDVKNYFYIKSIIDTNTRFMTAGSILNDNKFTDFIFDTLNIGYQNYNLINEKPIILSYKITDTSKYLDFQDFSLRNKNQRINLKGYYSFNSSSNLLFSANDVDLTDLSETYLINVFKKDKISGNIKYFNIKYEGTLKEPYILVEISTDNIKIDTNSVGYIYSIIKYKDNFLNPDIVLIDPVTNGKLLINGKIPINNPIISDTLDFDFLNKKVDLDINADNIKITLLEQYIPNIYNLHGILNGKLSVSGTPKDPDINGLMKIHDGGFSLRLNGLRYAFNLDLNPERQKLLVKNARIFFPEEKNKFITVGGYLDFTNLSLNSFNFDVKGDVKVLDNRISKNDFGFYGDLYAGSGTPPLKISGNSDYILLSGNLVLKKGKISMSTNENRAFSLYDDNYIYKVLIDSSSFSSDSLQTIIAYYKDTLSKSNNLNPFEKYFTNTDTLNIKSPVSSNKFIYDISVTTLNNIFVNFIIDEKTKQEFNGEITTSLFVDNKNKDSLEVRGRVDLEKNCTYKFYKLFIATGYIVFNGNPTNPELHIKAEYSGKSSDPNNSGSVRDVTVKLDVSGEASKPVLNWSILVNGNSIGGGDQTDQALSYIVFGKFKDELNASQRSNLFSNIGVNVGANIVSGYLSNFVQNILPFVINTDINYVDNSSGNIMQGTDIRFTAEFGDAIVRFGGQMFYDINNTNFVIEYPINKLFKNNWLSNNLIFQFERLIDPFTQNSTQINTNNRTGGIILYKINF